MQWNFKTLTPGDDYQGIRDGDIEVFDKTRYQSVVRETIQNSMDARKDYNKPVRVNFRFFQLAKNEFPSIVQIEKHLEACRTWEKANADDKELIGSMSSAIERTSYTCLEISDYNTIGMEASTSFDSFAHSRNVSTKTSTGSAGSKGMGKAAYFAASYLHTIFVTSKNYRTGQTLFQGISRLSTHEHQSQLKNYKGYYSDNFSPVLETWKIPPPFRRSDIGTSCFILGLWPDTDKQAIMEKELLNNFWLSILEGDLIVNIAGKQFNDLNIYNEIKQHYPEVYESGQFNTNPNPRPYIEAYLGKSCTNHSFEEKIDLLGNVRFVLAKNEEYQGRIVNFRKSKMLIFKDNSKLYTGYCGIFICDDPKGNEILKKLENATHTEWKAGNWKDPTGKQALKNLKEFQENCIKAFVGEQHGDEITIPGFDKLLNISGLSKKGDNSKNAKNQEKKKKTVTKIFESPGNNIPKTFKWLRSRTVREKDDFKYIVSMNSKKDSNKITFEVLVGSDDKSGKEVIPISTSSIGEIDQNTITLNLKKGINEVTFQLEDNLKHAIRLKEIKLN
jgi:hypothetical protein